MAAILKATPEEMISIAMELQGDINSLEQTMASIQKNVDRLNATWSGEAKNAFMEQYEGTDNYIRELIFMLKEYSDNLIAMSECYIQKEDNHIKGVANLPDDIL